MPDVKLINAPAESYTGRADFICTHPYGYIPLHLCHLPMVINIYGDRQHQAERWCRTKLTPIGRWGQDHKNTVFVGNIEPKKVYIEHLLEDSHRPAAGWFPLELPMVLLGTFAQPSMLVWDGFCGRATIGRACMLLDMHYVGMDIDPARIEISRAYLAQSL